MTLFLCSLLAGDMDHCESPYKFAGIPPINARFTSELPEEEHHEVLSSALHSFLWAETETLKLKYERNPNLRLLLFANPKRRGHIYPRKYLERQKNLWRRTPQMQRYARVFWLRLGEWSGVWLWFCWWLPFESAFEDCDREGSAPRILFHHWILNPCPSTPSPEFEFCYKNGRTSPIGLQCYSQMVHRVKVTYVGLGLGLGAEVRPKSF